MPSIRGWVEACRQFRSGVELQGCHIPQGGVLARKSKPEPDTASIIRHLKVLTQLVACIHGDGRKAYARCEIGIESGEIRSASAHDEAALRQWLQVIDAVAQAAELQRRAMAAEGQAITGHFSPS